MESFVHDSIAQDKNYENAAEASRPLYHKVCVRFACDLESEKCQQQLCRPLNLCHSPLTPFCVLRVAF